MEASIFESRTQGQEPSHQEEGYMYAWHGLILTLACVSSVSEVWLLAEDLGLGLTCPAYSERAWPLTSVKESGRSRLQQESLTQDQHLPKDADHSLI